MKLYDFALAPNPRRVRVFAAEKGIALDTVQVNIRAGEQFEESFRAINPNCTVPVLVLDDGTTLTDSFAICRYLEEVQPDPIVRECQSRLKLREGEPNVFTKIHDGHRGGLRAA